MLKRLVIHNVVLIEKLELQFQTGLCVLTGETGSGKSILLGALGLAMGQRAEQRWIRQGAEQASVSAEFDITGHETAHTLLDEMGIEPEDMLLIRRQVTREGKSRAWINDMPVTIAGLKQMGELLLEIHGQHAQRGLMDSATHRTVLDRFGGLETLCAQVKRAHADWRQAVKAEEALVAELRAMEEEHDYWAGLHKELEALNPEVGEENELAELRRNMQAFEKQAGDWQAVQAMLEESDGIIDRLRLAERQLMSPGAEEIENDALQNARAALAEALDRSEGAAQQLQAVMDNAEYDPNRLEAAEERLFALRALSRKLHCLSDELPAKREEIATRLQHFDHQQDATDAAQKAVKETEAHYRKIAEQLSAKRHEAAKRLCAAVHDELGPLKLGDARFEVVLDALPEGRWQAEGMEQVQFMLAANPGSPAGALDKVASGGELSRLMLAMKTALAEKGEVRSMVFDEVDTGIGGAVADAVGKRLARLAKGVQVFVVTHQPQVAAFAGQHFKVAKQRKGEGVETTVTQLSAGERREELARMLAGETITSQAREAADALLEVAV